MAKTPSYISNLGKLPNRPGGNATDNHGLRHGGSYPIGRYSPLQYDSSGQGRLSGIPDGAKWYPQHQEGTGLPAHIQQAAAWMSPASHTDAAFHDTASNGVPYDVDSWRPAR